MTTRRGVPLPYEIEDDDEEPEDDLPPLPRVKGRRPAKPDRFRVNTEEDDDGDWTTPAHDA